MDTLIAGICFPSYCLVDHYGPKMVQLRNQIRDNTVQSVSIPSKYTSGGIGNTTWNIDVTGVSLGIVVLGLTCDSVVAMALSFCMWFWVFTGVRCEAPVSNVKEERYSQES